MSCTTRALLDFIDDSPNSYYTVRNLARTLEQAGFRRLSEADSWRMEPGAGYYVIRNGSSLAAFRMPEDRGAGFQILACHSDSPCFRIKPNAELTVENRYVRLNVEAYGGAILSSWMDRPLSVAGRLLLRTPEGVAQRLVRVDRDLLVIPNLAIHMDRGVNDGHHFNIQKDMLPLFSLRPGDTLRSVAAEAAGAAPEDILDADLFLFNRMPGTVLGANGELLAAPRLDDLLCVYPAAMGLLESTPRGDVCPVFCLFDNEEVGSASRQGAASPLLRHLLSRISAAMGRSAEEHLRCLANSFMLSSDNAQGLHPNYTDKADPSNRPVLNGGVVLKYHAGQKYTTDGVSGALFRLICERAGVPVQTYVNRSDIPGGSTLGHISQSQVAVPCADVGLAQLAMHSAWETAGAADAEAFAAAAGAFFSASVRCGADGSYAVR